MADGDAVPRVRTACKYVADNGNTFRFRAMDFYMNQAGLGWVACDNLNQEKMPSGYKPRSVLLWKAADHSIRARLPVATVAAYNSIICGTTTFLACVNGAELSMVAYGKEGERERGKELD